MIGNARCEQSRFLFDDADSGAAVALTFNASDPGHRVGSWTKTLRFDHQLCSELPNSRLREEIKQEVQDLRATARIYERR